jgi:hypothetical protein
MCGAILHGDRIEFCPDCQIEWDELNELFE